MTNNWVPLHVHSDYSLLDGLSKPSQIAERCIKLGYPACAITDHGTISGCISIIKAFKDACKCGHQKGLHNNGKECRHRGCTCTEFVASNLKPILGSELYLSPKDPSIKDKDNRKLSHLVVLAKNLDGWKSLIRATSLANHPDNIWYKKPRLSLAKLADFTKGGNLIAFSGHPGSDLSNIVFADPNLAYKTNIYDTAKMLVRPDWKEAVIKKINEYIDIFGRDNFYLEINRGDKDNIPASDIVSKILRYVGKELNLPCIATCDAHFPSKIDAPDQRVLLCSQFETNLNTVEKRIEYGEDVTLGCFFKSNNYHIPSLDEVQALYTEDELVNTLTIADRCESYNVLGKPIMPSFQCLNGMSNDDYLRQLCENGWNRIKATTPKDELNKYKDRMESELNTFCGAGLAGYFLVVQDYVNYARTLGLVGPGRGSGAGCLVSYLIGITSIDPLPYGLMVERFYNAGRNTKDRVAFPDIDCDFPKQNRDAIITYIKNKYGYDKVSQMITFSRMQGKSAIKAVFRAHQACSFEEMNRITDCIPDEAAISDELQHMKERTGEASIIQWALENNAKDLSNWCKFNPDTQELTGEYATRFAQAIRMEGTKVGHGRHASGIVMAPMPLAEICPMVNTDNQMITGFEMNDAEAIGLIKFDVLGVAVLDKLMGVTNLLKNGRVHI